MSDFTTPSDTGLREGSATNIQFEHIASGTKVEFFAWISNFSDAYTSNWNSQELYGRMDPMMTFKNTSRKISLAWDVVGASLAEAKINMAKISRFVQMQYPTYAVGKGSKGGGGAAMIGSPPLLRAKFLNWIGSSLDGKGLVCALAGVTFKPNLDHGTFADGAKLYPQSFALSVEMTVLHEHPLGYSDSAAASVPDNFPYDVASLSALAQESNSPTPPAPNFDVPGNPAASGPSDNAADASAVQGGSVPGANSSQT